MLSKLFTLCIAVSCASAEEVRIPIDISSLDLETITFDPGFKMEIDFNVVRQAANVWFDTFV